MIPALSKLKLKLAKNKLKMPYRPEGELKRPDLKGEFLCGHCGKTFCHAASLNRHRLNFHGDDQICSLCNQKIPHNDTVRRHMQVEHHIPRVFTCGCCNWTFPDKKELHSHNNSMLKTGSPGGAQAIAVSSRPPGSLSQHELRGETRSPRRIAVKKRSKSKSPAPAESDQLMSLLQSLLAAQQPAAPQQQTATESVNPNWISHLLTLQPALLPLIATTSTSVTASEIEIPEESSSLDSVLALMANMNNNGEQSPSCEEAEEENVDETEVKNLLKAVGPQFLSVSTEEQPTSSGRESGIGSNTPSPVSTSTELVHKAILKAKKANKRKSVDEICFGLGLGMKRVYEEH